MKMPTGEVGILNVGAGDTKLVFDPGNPAETIRAAHIVKDMLRRGYALLVATGALDDKGRPVMVRARDFDEKTFEYVIADFDPVEAAAADAEEDRHAENEPTRAPRRAEGSAQSMEDASAAPSLKSVAGGKRGRGRPSKRLSAASTSAVAVARTAGG